jgi:hypothetical protein
MHVHRNETTEDPPEISKAAVTLLTEPDTTVAGGSVENGDGTPWACCQVRLL